MSGEFPNPDDLPVVDEIPELEGEPPEAEDPGERPAEAPAGPPVHHLEVICDGCRVRVWLNDAPQIELRADDPDQAEWYAPPVSPWLIGAGNEIEVWVDPLDDAADPRDALEAAEVELAVRRFARGEAVAPGAGPEVLVARLHDELRARIEASREAEAEGREEPFEVPQTFSLAFDNDGPAFRDELVDADPFDDEGALRDYAIRLRDLAAAGDAAGLVAEMEPKLQAYAAAYGEPRDVLHDDLLEGLRGDFLPLGVEAFERDEVELEPCAGGRVWALRRRGGAPLLATPPTDEGTTKQIEVFVAPRDGALRVVR